MFFGFEILILGLTRSTSRACFCSWVLCFCGLLCFSGVFLWIWVGLKMGSGNGFYSEDEFSLEAKWLIDPKHLFVGPKIGEGAHAKVYEGK